LISNNDGTIRQHVDSSIFLVLKILALPETKVGLAEFIKKAKENSAPQTT